MNAPRLRSAVGWSYVLSGGQSAITLAVTFILAAMLGPAAFGLLAMALVVMSFVEMLLNQGLLPAIVQRPVLEARHVDTAFWLVFPAGLTLSLLTFLSAPLWASISGTPQLTSLVHALSLMVPFQAAAIVPDALLRRTLRFRQLTIRSLVAASVAGIVAVVAAVLGFGVWALVLQQLVRSLVSLVVLYAAAGFRPQWRFDREAARDLYRYSLRSSLGSLGIFAGAKADVVLAGVFFGPVAVGIYRLGLRLTDVALEVTSRAMQSVSLPALARVQHHPAEVRSLVLRMFHLTSALALPVLGFLFGGASLVTVTLGGGWSDATIAIRGLAAAQAALALSLLCGPILQATGRPGLMAVLTWTRSIGWVGSLLVVGHLASGRSTAEQVMAMAFVAIVVSWANGVIAVVAVMRICGLAVLDLARAWSPAVIGFAVAAASSWGLSRLWDGSGDSTTHWARLTGAACASVMATAVVMVSIDPRLRELLRALRSAARRQAKIPDGAELKPVGPVEGHSGAR